MASSRLFEMLPKYLPKHILLRVINNPQCSLSRTTITRTILSAAYECNTAWNSRLSSNILSNIKMEEFYVELDKKFSQQGYIDAIDLDIFANNVRNEDQLYELEDLIHKFRRTPRTITILPSTPHACIRSYLNFNKTDDVLRVLQDKNNYGIFPDTYCHNSLLNLFIKNKNFKDASKIATLMMLQEDYGNRISHALALYSCHRYLDNPLFWEPPVEDKTEKTNDDDEEEETWVRVHFLRKDFYDDHFDIKDEKLLVGKTLWLFGTRQLDNIGLSSQLIGLCLYKKWTKVIDLLDNLPKDKAFIKSVVDKASDYLSKTEEDSEKIDEIKDKITALDKDRKIVDENVNEIFEKMTSEIREYEQEDIDRQVEIYDEWIKERVVCLNTQIEEVLRQERIQKIEAKKKELQEKEDLIFFFDNYRKYEMELQEIQDDTSASTKESDDYIVPEMPRFGKPQ